MLKFIGMAEVFYLMYQLYTALNIKSENTGKRRRIFLPNKSKILFSKLKLLNRVDFTGNHTLRIRKLERKILSVKEMMKLWHNYMSWWSISKTKKDIREIGEEGTPEKMRKGFFNFLETPQYVEARSGFHDFITFFHEISRDTKPKIYWKMILTL